MSSDIIIRRMNIEDLNDIQKLYAQQVDADDNPLTSLRISSKQHAWEMRRLRQQLLTEQRYLAYVAVERDEASHSQKMIGYAAAILEQQAHLFEVDTIASIEELWVAGEYRRRGVGKALIEELLCDIARNGIDWVTVHMPASAEDARAFFDKFGFEQKNVELQIKLKEN